MRPSIDLRRLVAASSFTAILLTVLVTTSGIAAAAGLFDPTSAIEMRAAPATPSGGTMRDALRGPSDGSLRNRLVSLNTGELARIVPAGADHTADRLERAKTLSAQ